MSAIGSIYILNRSAIPALVDAADDGKWMHEGLKEHARTEATYSWSGFVLAALLPVLKDNYGIDLLNSERALAERLSGATGATYIVLTYADRQASLSRLEPEAFNPSQLRVEFEAFNAMQVPEAEQFMPAGISFLRDGLRQVTEEDILVLWIG